ncbi:hypothetical protein C5L30_000246 [Companilactobacillus farciminis]|uniref:Uncharacterized protein n=1 Tax=Companilactobacillus farciminis TaxID=1612 RepID=A0A4R5NJR4_9LACO|nr:hypothetical protein [Companilactobacillus farciminis]ATO46102.1 hypothetical protein LF20184_04745 [Companilactobacillus farciminis KCTC 3681 = DSM 20184]TDG74530.1 hypothetical protein C5L30_000246 [Companilactobacillus farciminis]
MNRFQKKHIKEYLDDNKMSLDEIQQAFLDSFTMNQVSNEEAAALFVSLIRNMMVMPHNAQQLKDLGIDPTKLSIDTATELINVWAKQYVKDMPKDSDE